MSQVFLSYSRHDDEPFVKQLYEDLTENGIDVWWDHKSMMLRLHLMENMHFQLLLTEHLRSGT